MNRQIRKLAFEYLVASRNMQNAVHRCDPSRNHNQMTYKAALELARSTLRVMGDINQPDFG